MNLSKEQLAQMIDISAVKADSTKSEVELIVKAAKEHRFIAVFAMPSFTQYAKELLAGETRIKIGGTVGFPSGATTSSSKKFEARELIEIGCNELDMVINIGKLKSKMYENVKTDIEGVVEVAMGLPVKVILEVTLLTDDEIAAGAKIIRDSGARFIKTGTGWSGLTTPDHIQVIKKAVGDSIDIKVAGGVRKLDTMMIFYEMGVSRFGLGYKAALDVMSECVRKSKEA